jgi:Family of unknown function (DUF6502)
MEAATTTQALAAARLWLKPTIHVLLRSGVPWKEFAELAKSVYVEVATERFGKRGRPTNVSRTAVLTGLARRDVRKQRVKLSSDKPAPAGYVTKASVLLSAWHLHPEFTDKKGRPRPLPLEGERASFAALLKRCGGADVQATTLLKELIAAGCVRHRADGRLQALRRDYIPHSIDSQMLRLWASALAGLAMTAGHNLVRGDREPVRLQREAINDRIPAAALKEFRRLLEQEGQAFLERMDAWLTEQQVPPGQDAEAPLLRLGAGVYHIQD